METCGDEENNFSDVIENLMNMFGKVMSKDVISAVVESCEGDLNLSVDAIMNMTNDGNIISEDEQPTPSTQNLTSSQTAQLSQPSTSYASAAVQPVACTSAASMSAAVQPVASASAAIRPAHNTGAIPRIIQKPYGHTGVCWSDQIREIMVNHNQGNRILILLRGVPGSGKSHLAQQIVDMMIGALPINYRTHILSTDDYFIVRGQYQYDKYKLSEAHSWNHNRAKKHLKSGLSPVIIDNTNIELWEMEPYVREGIKNGYIIEVVEPKTPWAKKANQLVKKNIHNVPLVSIKRMLDNYRDGVTGEVLRLTYGLSYRPGMEPPVKRTIPPIPTKESPPSRPVVSVEEDTTTTTTTTTGQTDTNTQFFRSSTSTVETQQGLTIESLEQQSEDSKCTQDSNNKDILLTDEPDDMNNKEQRKLQLLLEAQKKFEEIEKVEKEWDNGDNWDTDVQGATALATGSAAVEVTTKINSSANITTLVTEAKPQRKTNMSPSATPSLEPVESLMQNVSKCQDWSKISMFMPPWIDSSELSNSEANQDVPVETASNGTCMEIGDTNVNGTYKVITATPRNINQFYISFDHEKIPQKRMLDKSSMTNEGIITNAFRCPNEEKHFIAFRKLFKNIARSDLRDIFDKCCGDVNWSVEIVLDGVNSNQFKTVDTEELSDQEEENMEQCSCLANYNIIPDVASPKAVDTTPIEDKVPVAGNGSKTPKKKRDVTMSDETVQMKRQIEQNVVIADNHYSKHCLKIRKIRRRETDFSGNYFEEPNASGFSPDAAEFESDFNCPVNLDISDDEDGSSASETDEDVIVNVNLGDTFISELDERFGRKDMQYPAYIVPRISLPLSVLNEINALWMESLTFQLDEHAKETAAMMQQDEEFARQIAMKEEELLLAGKEPDVPDFKEIMDMDMALAVYQKDVAEWRNNMPTDLAAKMTRDKLFNLFPDVDKDTLIELLMAHDNNFKATVEVLLMSTGRNDVLEQENGINKYVMAEEMKTKDKILKEQKKELSETDWPLLTKGEVVDFATVQSYREQADNHLARRNLNFQKAQEYIRRGMTQVANYYSELANFHKQKYDYASGLAVASLMQFHATNNPDCTTIDLHYFRVKEARESMDVFIDTHISKLRDAGNRRNLMLFFITGRGSHSQGAPRVKPATIQRLKQRGLGYTLKNPGLLAAKVNIDTKLTYQVSVP